MTSSASRSRVEACTLAALLCALASAQTPAEELTRMRRAWHEAQGVELKHNTTITLELKDGHLVATRSIEQERMALKGVAGMGSEDAVHYSTELMTLGPINAYTLSPGDRGYKKLKVEEITHKDELDDRIFHDDQRSANFMYPQVEPGAITHLDYSITYSDPRLVTGHFFATGEPVEESSLTIVSDPGVEVDVRFFHVDLTKLETERDEAHGKKITRYILRKVDPVRSEEDAPGYLYWLPHAEMMVKGYTDHGKKVELLGDVDRLYKWYWTHIDEARHVTPAIQALADSIVVRGDPEIENVRRIYQWVQGHVSYIAFEAGMKGLVPAPAEEVMNARYGDCKGMSCLLVNLMDAAHIPASLTWIGSREIPYRYDSVPSPAVDDHMIVVYDPEKTCLVLDATDSDLPFGMPSFFIQGKTMMIGLDSTRHLLREVPVMPASANVETDTTRVRIDGNGLVGSATTWYSGYKRSGMASLLHRVKPERHQELLRAVLERGNNKFTISGFTIANDNDRQKDLRITCDLAIGDIVQRGNKELYVDLNLLRPWNDRNYKADRTVAVENSYANTHRQVTDLEVPAGYIVGWLPDPVKLDDPRFAYSIAYEEMPASAGTPHVVRCRSEFTENKLMLEGADITAWRDMIKQLRVELDRSIVLKEQ